MRPALLSVAEAHERLGRLFDPLDPERVALAEGAGRVLRRDVVAQRAQPPFDASAMDGYAVRAADVTTGATLRVIGTSTAGARFDGAVGPGEAVRTFTGAPVPPGADRILIQEDADRDGDAIGVRADRDERTYVRPAGGDFAQGARVEAPRRLNPSDLALLAAMNTDTVAVTRRPVVALIATGDELVMPGETPGPDQIIASNAFGLKAMLDAAGAEARILPVARDARETLSAVLDLARGADLIVTLGGASVGDFDIVRDTAVARGMELDFYRVAMRPGKPLMAGRLNGTPLIGLPGNPVSAMVCGRIFLAPVVGRMLGLEAEPPTRRGATLGHDMGPNGPREHYMRATIDESGGDPIATVFERQDSSLLSVLSSADALVVRAPGDPARTRGDRVEFIWL